MKRFTQTFPLILAALLQLLPLLRNIVANPANASTIAFILRWGIGTGAAIGTVDAVSGASGTVMNTSSNITGTVGVPMSTNINFVINGGNTADIASDYVFVNTKVNNTGINSQLLFNNQATNLALPAGLTIKCVVVTGATNISALVSGTPTTAMTTNISITAGYTGGYTFTTNLQITISASSTTAPGITTQPVAGVTNLVGSSVGITSSTVSIVANGTGPLSYQWYFNTNTAVSGATSASLTLNNVQLSNAGYYRCTITNSSGATNSANALLTVWQPPTNVVSPAGVTVVAGGSASFSVTASGTPALTYQWYFSNSALSGVTNSTYNIANTRASQAGNYTVVITNSAGSITSSIAVLGVTNPLPPVITSPAKNGGGFQFTFIPVVGLTNTVLANGTVNSGGWSTFSNVPPPANANPVTVTDALGNSNRFYRVLVQP